MIQQVYSRLLSKKSLLFITVVLAAACGDEKVEKRGHPIVNTYAVSDLNEQGVTLNGEILDIGDGVKEYGFFYGPASITDDKSSYNDRIVIGSMESPGEFSAIANRNMIKDREYYYRAYAVAKLSNVLVLGQELKFVSKGSTPPVVKDFYPKEGTVGDEVVVVGSNFSSSPSGNFVKFGPITATITEIRKDTLIARVPNSTPLDGALVSVEVGQLKSESKDKFQILPVTFSSYEPAIAGFGDTVIVKGKNFPLYLQGAQATFLNFISYPVKSTRTEMKFVVSDLIKVIKSTVKISSGLQSTTFDNEIKLSPPVVTSFNPLKASKDVIVTITGNYFSVDLKSNTVTVAGKTLEVTAATRKEIKVKIPAGITPGKYPVGVAVLGQLTTSTAQLEIVKPEIQSVEPLAGTWGTVVTIKGQNFGDSPASNIVKFNDVTASLVSATSTEIKVTVPVGILSINSNVSVQVPALENAKETFATPFVLSAPEITSFTPGEGKSQTLITITGKNFHPTLSNNEVWFGNQATGNKAEVVSSTSTQLTVRPPSIGDTLINLTVKTFAESAPSPDKFHFISAWRKIKDFPGPARSDASAFTVDGIGYVGLGNVSGTAKKFWKYNPSSNVWTEVAEFTAAAPVVTSSAFLDIVSFSIGSTGYVGVGDYTSGDRGTIAKYDPVQNKWTRIATFPDKVRNATGFSINGKGYVGTGINTGNATLSNLWEYDATLDTWTKKKSIPLQRYIANAFTIGSKAYVVGGGSCLCGVSAWLSDLWEYNPATDEWTSRAAFPTQRLNPVTFSVNGKGYLLGGVNTSNELLADFYEYDPSLNQWKLLGDFPGGPRDGAVAFVINNKVYVGTGRSSIGGLSKDFWELDPTKL